ncbi:MAG: MFS transporter [Gammaproteobacteria bacterium]|nr:MFS transporter [Gammaproteobacteria bacterium]
MRRTTVDSGYAWLRLAASLALTTVGCAGMYLSMVGVPAYQNEFSVTRAEASLPFSLLMLGFGVGGVVIGRCVDRFGIVRPMAVSTVLLACALLLAARAENYVTFVLLHAMIGAFGCAAVFSPLLADISRWFLQRRGFAIAVCASGNYLAGMLWPPIMSSAFIDSGWRWTYGGLGLLSAMVMLPLLAFLLPRSPTSDAHGQEHGSIGSAATLGFTPGQLTALLSLAGIGCCTAMAMPQAHMVALTMDVGLTAQQGAEMLSVMFGCGVISRLVFGWLSDRIGGLATLLIGSGLQCVALVLFLPAEGLYFLFAAAALFGLFQGGIVPCYALIVREYFPEAKAASRIGVVVFATLIGMAFGAWVSGLIYDWTGSYDVAFLHGICWNLLNMAIVGLLLARQRSVVAGVSAAPGH